jgi:hypothetical protein
MTNAPDRWVDNVMLPLSGLDALPRHSRQYLAIYGAVSSLPIEKGKALVSAILHIHNARRVPELGL